MEDAWILEGTGKETVAIIGCSRESGNVVMGPHGPLGSAAKGVRYLSATGANGIIQVGMDSACIIVGVSLQEPLGVYRDSPELRRPV